MMAVINHDAEFYENASEDLIEELVNKDLASMQIDFNDIENNDDVNKYLYENLKKSQLDQVDNKVDDDDYNDDDDVIFEANSVPDIQSDTLWSRYQEKMDDLFDTIDNDLLESERLLKNLPKSARDVIVDIRKNIATALNENYEDIEKTLEASDDDEELENENISINDANIDDGSTETLEKEFKLKLKEFEESERKKDEIRKREEDERKRQIENEQKESELKWQQIQEKLKHEKEQIELQKQQIEEQHNKMMINQQKCIDRNLEILKINLDVYTNNFEIEKSNLIKYETEKKTNATKKQVKAAIFIQKFYRGYRVRKIYRHELKTHIKDALEKREKQKVLELELEMRQAEEKKAKVEAEKRKKIEQEIKRKKEQKEFEREMEKLRLKQIEEEKQRLELERLAFLEQEENDRKALMELESLNSINETHKVEEPVVISENDFKEPIMTNSIESNIIEESNEAKFSNHELNETHLPTNEENFDKLLPLNFEALVNQALHNELKLVPNLPLQLEALKLEEQSNKQQEEENKVENKSSPKLDMPQAQKELFEEWHKHNFNNFFENIKQEYETKIKQKDSKLQQNRLRPNSSRTKQIQSIPENILLKRSNKKSLNEIDVLYFHALTAYSLNTLELCTNLTILVLTNSQISILDSLQNCMNLKYINAQSNKIEWVDLHNLSNLIYLNLSNNNLSSIQNLSNCNNLRYLNLSHNKITRLSSLNHNYENLQFLNVSNNQLINTIGLSNCVHLQFIDLSSNNLNSVEDIDSLALLLELNGSKNNLLQIPDLINQILLITLQLNDNSITNLIEIKNYWMPLLNEIELNQNCIDRIFSVNGLFNINKILIENNNLCDIESINEIKNFKFLNEVQLTNNPIINEDKIEIENFNLVNDSNNNFFKLVRDDKSDSDQHSEFDIKYHENICKIIKFVSVHKSKINLLIEKCQSFSDQVVLSSLDELISEFNILRDFIIKLRFMFEANDLNSILNIDSHLNSYHQVPSRPTSSKLNEKNRVYSARLERIKGLRNSRVIRDSVESRNEAAEVSNQLNIRNNLEEAKLEEIDIYVNNLKRKYSLETLNKTAAYIQSRWNGYKTRKELDRQVANMAATIIQSRWRGYLVRKRIEEARKKFSEDNQFEFEEIDLDQFVYDESKFDVKIPVAPQKQFINAFLDASNFISNKPPRPPAMTINPLPPVIGSCPSNIPKKAWKNDGTPRTNSAASNNNEPVYEMRQNVPILYSGRSLNSASTQPDSEAIMFTSKQETIANDWGFKDHRTAMLMLQRADKMKYKVERKNKLKSLDPKERLKLLKKLDKYTPRVTTTHRSSQNLFINHSTIEENVVTSQGQDRTYEWLHSQVRDLPLTPSNNQPNKQLTIEATKVPKLPQISNGNNNNNNTQWRNGSSSSNSTLSSNNITKTNKTPINTSKHNILPPLNHLKLSITHDSQFDQHDQYSIASSRSSFTNMFFNPKATTKPSNKLNETNKRKKEKID